VEVIAVVSTLVLFHECRGPGYRLVTRFARFIERRGQVGLATGRATPGLRR